jgi:hypothetical protein
MLITPQILAKGLYIFMCYTKRLYTLDYYNKPLAKESIV